jgi:hypothetical protein
MIRTGVGLLMAGLLMASGCGLKGELERPGPLWGDPPLDGADDPRSAPADDTSAGTG